MDIQKPDLTKVGTYKAGVKRKGTIGRSGVWQGTDFHHVIDNRFGSELVNLLREDIHSVDVHKKFPEKQTQYLK